MIFFLLVVFLGGIAVAGLVSLFAVGMDENFLVLIGRFFDLDDADVIRAQFGVRNSRFIENLGRGCVGIGIGVEGLANGVFAICFSG